MPWRCVVTHFEKHVSQCVLSTCFFQRALFSSQIYAVHNCSKYVVTGYLKTTILTSCCWKKDINKSINKSILNRYINACQFYTYNMKILLSWFSPRQNARKVVTPWSLAVDLVVFHLDLRVASFLTNVDRVETDVSRRLIRVFYVPAVKNELS